MINTIMTRDIRELRISVANELKESEEEAEMLADAKLRPGHDHDGLWQRYWVLNASWHDANVFFLKAWILYQSSTEAAGYNQVL